MNIVSVPSAPFICEISALILKHFDKISNEKDSREVYNNIKLWTNEEPFFLTVLHKEEIISLVNLILKKEGKNGS